MLYVTEQKTDTQNNNTHLFLYHFMYMMKINNKKKSKRNIATRPPEIPMKFLEK